MRLPTLQEVFVILFLPVAQLSASTMTLMGQVQYLDSVVTVIMTIIFQLESFPNKKEYTALTYGEHQDQLQLVQTEFLPFHSQQLLIDLMPQIVIRISILKYQQAQE